MAGGKGAVFLSCRGLRWRSPAELGGEWREQSWFKHHRLPPFLRNFCRFSLIDFFHLLFALRTIYKDLNDCFKNIFFTSFPGLVEFFILSQWKSTFMEEFLSLIVTW